MPKRICSYILNFGKKNCLHFEKRLPEFKIYQPILFGIFLIFETINIASEPNQQNLISARIVCLESLYLHISTTLYETHCVA